MDSLKPPPALDLNGGNVAERWRKWEQQFSTYHTACELSEKAGKTQVAILLHAAGPEAQDVFQTFTYTGDQSKEDYETVLSKFRAHCEPKKNEDIAIAGTVKRRCSLDLEPKCSACKSAFVAIYCLNKIKKVCYVWVET